MLACRPATLEPSVGRMVDRTRARGDLASGATPDASGAFPVFFASRWARRLGPKASTMSHWIMATTSGGAITVGLLGSSPRRRWRWAGERVVFLVLATGVPLCTTLLVGQRYGWSVLAIIGGALALGLIAERLDTSPWPSLERQRNWLTAGVIAGAWSAVPVITWIHSAGVTKDVDTCIAMRSWLPNEYRARPLVERTFTQRCHPEPRIARAFAECRGLTTEQLEDLYQETAVAMLRRPYGSEEHLRNALRHGIKHRALNMHRDTRRRAQILAQSAPSM
jgi:hypothetical protein